MRSTSLKGFSLALLIVAIVGCASKKTDDSAETTTVDAPAEVVKEAEAAPAESEAVTGTDTGAGSFDSRGAAGAEGAGWEGFESNPANYTGDTRQRVIYFSFDRAEIPQAAYASLKAHAQYLAKNGDARLKIEGNCDERGTPEYNIALGERRAKSIKQFLELNGARAGQLEVVSYGEEKPAELGHDELSWAKNRRGELVYTAGKP